MNTRGNKFVSLEYDIDAAIENLYSSGLYKKVPLAGYTGGMPGAGGEGNAVGSRLEVRDIEDRAYL